MINLIILMDLVPIEAYHNNEIALGTLQKLKLIACFSYIEVIHNYEIFLYIGPNSDGRLHMIFLFALKIIISN